MQRFLNEAGQPTGSALLSPGLNMAFKEQSVYAAPVEDFPAPRLDPLCYPSVRPEYSFMTSEGKVWPLGVRETANQPQFIVPTAEGNVELNEILQFYDVSTMENRFPIVGFGSNACPGQLSEKFSELQNKWQDITEPGDHHIVPTLRATMSDVAAAYSSRLGIHGYVFAELVAAEGVESEVFVNFLSQGQLCRMIRSEGAYELCNLGEVAISGLSKTIPAYGFAGKNEVLHDTFGQPILMKDISQKDLFVALAQEFGPQLDAYFPDAPVFANDASTLMAYSSYRQEFVRRKSDLYKYKPYEGHEDEDLPGVVLQRILREAGRVSADKLLDTLSDQQRNVQPLAFGQLYNLKIATTSSGLHLPENSGKLSQ
jgi:hypothetical protein